MKVKVFHYKVIGELSIDKLKEEPFTSHRRLKVFYKKGCKCVSCKKEGKRLIQGVDAKGNLHWDVYDENLYPITVDHIIPKSRGGGSNIENLQPMCAACNTKKRNKLGL